MKNLTVQNVRRTTMQTGDVVNLTNMVNQKASQVANLQNSMMAAMAEMVEFRDKMTGGHITRTQKYLQVLVGRLLDRGYYKEEVSSWNIEYLLPSAQLHDVGKIAIRDTILNKPGKLTADEFEEMKTHTDIGVQIIESIARNTKESSFLRHARVIAGTHHEKWDGTGYPRGLSGTNIPLEGRLMAIADVYDALISARPYKEPYPPQTAKQIIEEGENTHFDPVLVDLFRSASDQFAAIALSYN